eukprot:TRINITY_DN5367_c0_g1_i1.p1 TRINITY_DN5367_c0_g1~~TRINITY_DN5367_c0_g1_i1.p1  ORF type:complete len:457 (-),score=104.48 TRINITY_DN5367_c0_g1_i1:34-1404(-)
MSEDKGDLWQQILKDASSNRESITQRNLVLLGDRNSGKSALLTTMRGGDMQGVKRTMLALDYSFIDVLTDESEEDVMSRIHVWQLDGDTDYKDLIPLALSDQNFDYSAVFITLDFRKPWNLIDSLNAWFEFLAEHVHKRINPNQFKKGRKKVLKYYQTYREGKSRAHDSVDESDDEESDLEEDLIPRNLGIPIIVVCTKCDFVEKLEVERGFTNDHFVYIQTHLRKLCLEYGAALVYSSARADINCDILLHYLQHRLYSKVPFDREAQTQEKAEVFVPFGFDTTVKIDTDFAEQNLTKDITYPYEDIIVPPVARVNEEAGADPTVHAVPDELFLQTAYEKIESSDRTLPANSKRFLENFQSDSAETPTPDNKIHRVEFDMDSPYATPKNKEQAPKIDLNDSNELKAKFYQLLKNANSRSPTPTKNPDSSAAQQLQAIRRGAKSSSTILSKLRQRDE